jgi:hypothetical protein
MNTPLALTIMNYFPRTYFVNYTPIQIEVLELCETYGYIVICQCFVGRTILLQKLFTFTVNPKFRINQ